jgi:hypothetical protein
LSLLKTGTAYNQSPLQFSRRRQWVGRWGSDPGVNAGR